MEERGSPGPAYAALGEPRNAIGFHEKALPTARAILNRHPVVEWYKYYEQAAGVRAGCFLELAWQTPTRLTKATLGDDFVAQLQRLLVIIGRRDVRQI